MALSLQKAPSLEELNIASSDAKDWLSPAAESASLQVISQNPKLQVVCCRGKTARGQVMKALQENHDALRLATTMFIFVN